VAMTRRMVRVAPSGSTARTWPRPVMMPVNMPGA
jgi:hypothetical protein